MSRRGLGKDALEDLVERFRERGSRTEARRQVENPPVPGEDAALEALIERDVGPPKAVDRLLRVSDDEERARLGRQLPDVARVRSRRRQDEQQLGLERIGVLELVHEEVRQTLPEARRTNGRSRRRSRVRSEGFFVGEEAMLASRANGRFDSGIEKADGERVQELAPFKENGFGDRFAETFRLVGYSLSRRLGLPFPLRRPSPCLEEGEDARNSGIRLELGKLARAERAPDLLLEIVLDGRLFVGQRGSGEVQEIAKRFPGLREVRAGAFPSSLGLHVREIAGGPEGALEVVDAESQRQQARWGRPPRRGATRSIR